jgi:hypothetical protein
MQTEKLLEALNDIERKGLELENKSFKCGIHTDDETQKAMRDAERVFSDAILNLGKQIISEGV